jgi:putative polyhydroxyalkanoate system protein
MATIDIRHPHNLSKEDARTKAEDLARGMKEKLGIEWKWDGDRIQFDAPGGAAKGVTGQVQVGPSDVHIQIDLPFLLRAMKGTIESKVRERLAKSLG